MENALRKVTYRLYPSRTQAAALDALLDHHRALYNACLEERRDAWNRRKVSVDYKQQCAELTTLRREMPEWAAANCSSQQATLRRLDLAFKAFFRRVAEGAEEPGYPRFKGRTRFTSVGFKGHGDGWRFLPGRDGAHGKLRLQGVGIIKARGRMRQAGEPRSCQVMRTPFGWELSLTVLCPAIKRRGGAGVAAFDWGVETFLTLAIDAPGGAVMETVANPRWFRVARDRLAAMQRGVERKKRGSTRRRKAGRAKARFQRRAVRRRDDWQHKLSAKLAGRFGALAWEKLRIANMTRSAEGTAEQPGTNVRQKAGLNREILDTAPGAFLRRVSTKVAETGCIAEEAPTRTLRPSQTCPECGSVRKKLLSERTHACLDCHHVAPRDFASACVVLHWLRHRLAPYGRESADAA